MKTKKLIALLLAAAMCLSMAACGTTAQASAEATAEPASETEAPVESEATVESGGDITVTVEDDDEAYDDVFLPCVESIDSFESETVTYYPMDADNAEDMEVWFINGYNDVPYISLETVVQILTSSDDDEETTYALNIVKPFDDMDIFVMTRENGATMTVDFEADELTFSDIDMFVAGTSAANGVDIVATTTNGADDNILIDHANVFYRNPDAVTVCLTDYNIPMVSQNGTGYLPLQTVSDFITSRIGAFLVFNGQAVILATDLKTTEEIEAQQEKAAAEAPSGTETPAETDAPAENETLTADEEAKPTMGDIYYSAPAAEKSEMLRVFNYNELCMALDYNYGLQEEHNISSFNHLFIQTGLADRLMSSNSLDTYRAVSTLTLGYFADLHSAPGAHSYMDIADEALASDPYAGLDYDSYVYDFLSMQTYQEIYSGYRAMYYPDGCPGYEEVGNTAYITFDSFYMTNAMADPDYDYYANEPSGDTTDVLELIMYANEQIHRENSPIQNVVVDLTNNGGGQIDVAVSLLSWMLGSCTLSMEDTISGAQSTTAYAFDANRDGQYDENDSLGYMNYNLYCLISPCSFSCGNLVPAALSANHFVTLIGDSSSGGTCSVFPMSTADGTTLRISGPYRISTMNNGTYYSVDQGVNPDDYIDKLEHLYDREYLTDYINNLA